MTSFEEFQDGAADGQEWEIEYDFGMTRTTSLSWIAYQATDDPEATVTEL